VARVVFKKFKARRPSKADTTTVGERRVLGLTGRAKKVLTLDANSKTFDLDLQYVFQRNVAKARRENRKVTGRSDRAPAKG
jgi:hypothetical protein